MMNHRASSAWVIQRAQERQRDAEKKPDIAREDPGVPVQKKQARVERQGRTPAEPGQGVLPGAAPRWRPDSAVRLSYGPGDGGQQRNIASSRNGLRNTPRGSNPLHTALNSRIPG